MRLTSANSVNVGRLLPQMVYYFHAVAQVRQRAGQPAPATARRRLLDAERQLRQPDRRTDGEARRAADRAVRRRDQRRTTSCRSTWRPAASSRARRCRRWRMRWTSATRATSSACRGCTTATSTRCAATSSAAASRDDEVRETIRRVYESAAICSIRTARSPTWGSQGQQAGGSGRQVGIFLATAHPAKFAEIVEPIIGRRGREAGAAGAGARAAAPHHPDRGVARRGEGNARWVSRGRFVYRADVLEQLLRHGVRPTEPDAARAGARFRPRSLQVRDPPPARALSCGTNSRRSSMPAGSTRCAAYPCSRCTRASSSKLAACDKLAAFDGRCTPTAAMLLAKENNGI